MDLDILWKQFYYYKPMFDELYATWVVSKMPVNDDVPVVLLDGVLSASATPGGVLGCSMGNWQNMEVEPHAYAYDWQRDEVSVLSGPPSYTVTPDDVGHAMTCVVTATNSYGSVAAPASNKVTVADTARGRAATPEEPEERSRTRR